MSYNYHQLLEYVYFEGYANSYEEAEYLLNQLNNEEFYDLYENVFSSKFPGAVTADADEEAAKTHKTLSNAENTSPRDRKLYRDTAAQHLVSARRKRRKNIKEFYRIDENTSGIEFVIDYLVNEGYTDNYNSAISIYESMSNEWLDTILEVKGGGKVSFTGNTSDRGMPINPSDKLYRKKIKVETDMEDEEKRIRTRNRAQQPDEYNELRPGSKKSQRKGGRRDAAASRETRTSPIMQSLQKRFERLSDADYNMRNRR